MEQIIDTLTFDESKRFIDVEDDLIPVEDIKAEKYKFVIPTIIPEFWKIYQEINIEEYIYEINTYNPCIVNMLQTTTNTVIAGGAAARPLIGTKNNYSDIDIFIYGIFDEYKFWEKVNEIANKLIILSLSRLTNLTPPTNLFITQKMKKGIVVICISNCIATVAEYQIILRMYHTMSSIIHSFDIPSCCVLFNGFNAYTTRLGAFAHSNMVNLVNTKYRSTSFERRLVKYFERGYGVGFIGYDLNSGFIEEKKVKKLKHKYLDIFIHDKEGNKITGIINVTHHRKQDNEYSNIKNIARNYGDLLIQIQSLEDDGIILTKNDQVMVDYTYFAESCVKDIIKKYTIGINDLVNKYATKICKTPIWSMKEVPLPKKVIKELIVDFMDNDKNGYYIEQKIERALYEQLNANADYLPEWIIVQDPQRQYTSAINPIIEDPEEWYGQGLFTIKLIE